MALLVYKGGARDHADTPVAFQRGVDGKIVKRLPAKFRRDYSDVATYHLWGVDFPMGEEVEVSDPDLVKKALALGFFRKVEVAVALEVGDAEPAPDPDEPDTAPKRRRGRPRKTE